MEEEKDKTNWRAWYWGIFLFFILQVILFILISNYYSE